MTEVTLERLLALTTVEADEAVAILQQLIAGGGTPETETTSGELPLSQVLIGTDGIVRDGVGSGRMTVAAVAALLQRMLPEGCSTHVPGALRYTMARAAGTTVAEPFASLADLSAALRRLERRDRLELVKRVIQRVANPGVDRPHALLRERRKHGATVEQLRRGVREADRQIYELLNRPSARPAVPTSGPTRRALQWLPYAAAVVLCMVTGYIIGTDQSHPATSHPSANFRGASVPAISHTARTSPHPPLTSAPIFPTKLPLPRSAAALWVIDPGVGAARVSREPAIERVLTDTGAQFSPAFGRGGRSVFFHTGRTMDRASALMVASVDDGRVETVLDDGARNYHVQPSPDGRSIAFDSDRDGERGVYVASRDGADVRRVSGSGYGAVPSWSPAGDRITFIRAEARRTKVWNLWLLSLETGETARLTNYSYGQTWGAAWFFDGRRICYTHEDRLIVHDVQTGVRREYLTPVPGRIVRTPAVSPSGDAIVFQVYRNGVWLLDLRSNTMHQVLRDRSAEEFSWSPNGQRIAFHSRRDGKWALWAVVSAEIE